MKNIQHMTTEQRQLLFHLLGSPLFLGGMVPDWYNILCAASRMGIGPWVLSGEEPTEAVRKKWQDRALDALEIELDVEDIKRKNPEWFKELSPIHRWLMDQIRLHQSEERHKVIKDW